MIEKKTIIDQIEITRDGTIQVRLGLLLIEDGVEISCKWHRTVIEPGGDVDAQISAVAADITTRPELRAGPLEGDKIPMLKSIVAVVHAPKTVSEFRAKKLKSASTSQ